MCVVTALLVSCETAIDAEVNICHRYEEMKIIIKTMRNHKKIKDMSNVLSGEYLLL